MALWDLLYDQPGHKRQLLQPQHLLVAALHLHLQLLQAQHLQIAVLRLHLQLALPLLKTIVLVVAGEIERARKVRSQRSQGSQGRQGELTDAKP